MLSRKCYQCLVHGPFQELEELEGTAQEVDSKNDCMYSGTQNGTIEECDSDHDFCQKTGNLI